MSKMIEYWIVEIIKRRKIWRNMSGNRFTIEEDYEKRMMRIHTSDDKLALKLMKEREKELLEAMHETYMYCYPFNDQIMNYRLTLLEPHGSQGSFWKENATMETMTQTFEFVYWELYND